MITPHAFKRLRAEYLGIAFGLLLVGLATSMPLHLDFNRTLNDVMALDTLLLYLVPLGLLLVLPVRKHLITRGFIYAHLATCLGLCLLSYPLLSLVSAVETPSGYLVIAAMISPVLLCYFIAHAWCQRTTPDPQIHPE